MAPPSVPPHPPAHPPHPLQFLGDFVDRGAHSLETICLLLALKIEHPRSVHLIRGNHEAADINALFGFRLECLERLGDQQGLKAWQRLNTLFNWLPLAALIEDKARGSAGAGGVCRAGQLPAVRAPATSMHPPACLPDQPRRLRRSSAPAGAVHARRHRAQHQQH